MKTLREYLTESVKSYDYRIKIAGELDDEVLKSFEQAMQRYDVVKMSKPKKTPVMKSPAGFPELQNQEVNIIDVTVNYPASVDEVTEIWHRAGGDPNKFRMLSKRFDDAANQEAANAEESPILEKDFPADTSEQKTQSDDYAAVGADKSVVKNSAAGAKFEIAGGKTPPAATTNDLPMGDKSPISGTNKIPTPKSSAK